MSKENESDDEYVPESKRRRQDASTPDADLPAPLKSDFLKHIEEKTKCLGEDTSKDLVEPSQLLNATLKDYQLEGLRWTAHLNKHKLNGILADEMGLGKTLQSVALMLHLTETAAPAKLFMVVAPLSIVQNWQSEVERFAPSMSVLVYLGNQVERDLVRTKISSINSATIVITTFEMVNKDADYLKTILLDLLVIDEAQRLKNYKSRVTSNVLSFRHRSILLMTGTPVQNDLDELNTLLHVANPTIFYKEPTMMNDWFGSYQLQTQAQKYDRVKELWTVIKPFILRREKELAIKDLPIKREAVLYCGISAIQKRLYKSILRKDSRAFEGSKQVSINNVFMQLRKCVNHPYIFPGIEVEPFEIGDHIINSSGKLWLLDKLLAELKKGDHKVLLFSQMTSLLDILQDYLQYRGYSYERLDGSVRSEERFTSIKNFTDAKSDTFVFLLSTRAGGVGLNLGKFLSDNSCLILSSVNADTVIFFDSDFNPQMDLQAASRAHRIGQTRPVLVLRMVARGTVEELIMRRADAKLLFSQQVMKPGQFTGAIGPSTTNAQNEALSMKDSAEFSNILKFGLDKMMDENEESTITEDDIKQILNLQDMSRHPTVKQEEEDGADASPASGMYTYDGQDYSKCDTKDQSAFDVLMTTTTRNIGASSSSSSSAQFTDSYEELERQKQLAKVNREKQRAEKLAQLWLDNNYIPQTLKFVPIDDTSDLPISDKRIKFISGDATKPRLYPQTNVIVHCVDNSGMWTRGGVFGALSRLSTVVEDAFSLAHAMSDLHMGDCHVITIPDAYCQRHMSGWSSEMIVQVALIVAQKRQNGRVGRVEFSHLENGLKALQQYVSPIDATVHMPRIGQGIPGFDWYAAERTIQKCLCAFGVDVFVYYFQRAGKSRPTYTDSRLVQHSDGGNYSMSESDEDSDMEERSDDEVDTDQGSGRDEGIDMDTEVDE